MVESNMYYSRSQASTIEESVVPCLSYIVWLRIREELCSDSYTFLPGRLDSRKRNMSAPKY
jgi:hypothetical protein